MSETKKKKPIRTLVFLLILIAAVVIVGVRVKTYLHVRQENAATAAFNAGNYQEAVDGYLALLPKLDGQDAERVEESVAECYLRIGESPETSAAEQMRWYKKALEYDEDCITSPTLLKSIRAYTAE